MYRLSAAPKDERITVKMVGEGFSVKPATVHYCKPTGWFIRFFYCIKPRYLWVCSHCYRSFRLTETFSQSGPSLFGPNSYMNWVECDIPVDEMKFAIEAYLHNQACKSLGPGPGPG